MRVGGQNDASKTALANLQIAKQRLSKSLTRLSSGSHITSPEDDAAGLAQSIKLNNQSIRIDAAIQNNQNLTSLLRTQDAILDKAVKAVKRLSELYVLSQDITKSTEDKKNIRLEYTAIQNHLQSLTEKKFNGISLFSSSSIHTVVDEKGTTRALSGIDLGEAIKTWMLKFDGVDDYAEISNLNVTTDDYSIEVKLGESSSGTVIGLMRSDSNINQFLIDANYINNSEVWMNEGAVLSTPALTGEHTLSITADGNGSITSFKAYQNGTEVANSASVSSVLQNHANNHPWVLGNDWDGNVASDFFSGNIYELRVWNDLRTASQIEQNYDKKLNGDEEGLIGYWDFEGISGLEDKTGISGDITLNGASLVDSSDEDAGVNAFNQIENNLANLRAKLGSRIAATNNDINSLQQLKENLSSSVSKISDTDFADEATKYARYKILNQSATAMLSQANTSFVNVLQLL